MTTNPLKDWNPETYSRFRGFRLRPALDLLAQVPRLPSGDVVDLGCGAGAVGPTLATQFGRPPIGIDSSPAMLAEARSTRAYGVLRKEDASHWQPDRPPGLIFSNALCHWLPDHDALFPRLARVLAPGGTLAVQMPRQYGAPSHALLRELAVRLTPNASILPIGARRSASRNGITGCCRPSAICRSGRRITCNTFPPRERSTRFRLSLPLQRCGHFLRSSQRMNCLPFARPMTSPFPKLIPLLRTEAFSCPSGGSSSF